MKRVFISLLLGLNLYAAAQTTIANAGFENWGNSSPGVAGEPAGWYSNKSGSNIAKAGPTICYQDATVKHSGSYSVRVETTNYLGTAVNGAVTTGIINAPTFTKSDGYIGTINYSSASDMRYMNFVGKPDSIVGWYQYVSGGAGEQPKLRAILHTGDYFDPETPTTYHGVCTSNKIADALWLGGTSSQSAWKRFSVPFNYVSSATPTHIMINITSSASQSTSITGSKLWVDDLDVIYNTSTGIAEASVQKIKVYSHDKTVYVDFTNKGEARGALSIYDLTGKVIASTQAEPGKLNSFDFSEFAAGLYFYKLSVNGTEKSGKLIFE